MDEMRGPAVSRPPDSQRRTSFIEDASEPRRHLRRACAESASGEPVEPAERSNNRI